MNRSVSTMMMCLIAGGCLTLGGCNASQQQKQAPEPMPAKRVETKPAVKAEPAPLGRGTMYDPAITGAQNKVRMAFPTGDMNTSAILTHLITPKVVRPGQNYDYEIHVTNLTNSTLQNVMLSDSNFSNLALVKSSPAATAGTAGAANWSIGDLSAGETKKVIVTGKAEKVGTAGNCINVTYNNTLCAVVQVVEPKLEVTKAATPEVLLCDNIELTYTVKNPGSGIAENVMVRDTLAAGLTADGKPSIEWNAGTLAAGESKTQKFIAKASKTGTFNSPASAMSGDLKADAARVGTIVKKPMLTVVCKAGGNVIADTSGPRPTTYEFTIKNTGDGVAKNAAFAVTLPAGATDIKSDGAAMAAGSFNLGDMAAGQERKVSVTFRPAAMGTVRVSGQATAACCDPVPVNCTSEVIGLPAMLLTGGDEPDPVQIGGTTTYTLVITNQGNVTLTNVKLNCNMEDGESMAFVSAEGNPTKATNSGKAVTFAPLATLAPKASATYKIVVRAVKEGQVSFRSEASSDQITRALIKTETTNFYK